MMGKYLMVFLIYENDHFGAADGLTPLNKYNIRSHKVYLLFTVLGICVGRPESYW